MGSPSEGRKDVPDTVESPVLDFPEARELNAAVARRTPSAPVQSVDNFRSQAAALLAWQDPARTEKK